MAATVAVVLAWAAVFAQDRVAPPPHPPLAEVVKEYVRLGLPLPPDAEFVRVEVWLTPDDEGTRRRRAYRLAFRMPAARGFLRSPRPDWGYDGSWPAAPLVTVAPRTPAALDLAHLDNEQALFFAVSCKLRGWDDLAAAAYARCIDLLGGRDEWDERGDVRDALRELAWSHFRTRLTEPNADRKKLAAEFRATAARDPDLAPPAKRRFLDRVEATATRHGKPGTVAALIDDLTEYWEDDGGMLGPRSGSRDESRKDPYWRLAERGFDAVPELLKHLDDDRLARGGSVGLKPPWIFELTVGHLCSRLVFDLSGRTVGGDFWERRGDFLDAGLAAKWFDAAKKVGEEQWLLSRAIPTDDGGRAESLIVRVLAAKYPDCLPQVYRTMLGRKASYQLDDFVPEIVGSKLPAARKVALLEEGVAHADSTHRYFALRGLAEVDHPLFCRRVLRELERVRAELVAGKGWFLDRDEPSPFGLGGLVEQANTADVWRAFAAATKAAPTPARMDVIGSVWVDPRAADTMRAAQLRFLAQFLDDRSVDRFPRREEYFRDWDGAIGVRDVAASRLAQHYGIPLDSDPTRIDPLRVRDLGTLSRLVLREQVRHLAARELAGRK